MIVQMHILRMRIMYTHVQTNAITEPKQKWVCFREPDPKFSAPKPFPTFHLSFQFSPQTNERFIREHLYYDTV